MPAKVGQWCTVKPPPNRRRARFEIPSKRCLPFALRRHDGSRFPSSRTSQAALNIRRPNGSNENHVNCQQAILDPFWTQASSLTSKFLIYLAPPRGIEPLFSP